MRSFFFVFVSVTLLGLSACRNSDRDLDNDTSVEQDVWVAMNQVTNIIREVHKVAIVDSVLNNIDSADALSPEICYDTIIRNPDTTVFPVDLQIIYTDTLVCDSTRNRGGKINATFSGFFTEFGTTIRITPEKFHIADYYFTGEITMKMVGKTPDTLIYEVSVQNARIEDARGVGNNITTFSGNFVWIQYSGRETITATDDQFTYHGTGNGIAQNGVIFNFDNQVWALLDAGCDYESSGQFTVRPQNSTRQNRVMNFGSGNCDNKMVVTIPPVNGTYDVRIR